MTLAKTQVELKKQYQQLARVTAKLVRAKHQLRKLDTHHKIRWGGLIMIAGLEDWNDKALLNALNEQWQCILDTPEHETLFQSLGEKAFREYRERKPVKRVETKASLRRKIQRGGLLKKSGWTVYDADVILGMLVSIKQQHEMNHG